MTTSYKVSYTFAQLPDMAIADYTDTNDQVLMGSDAPPDRYEAPKGFSMSLNITDPAEAERVFKALAEKGKVVMPLEKTFWAERFGMLADQFGIPWMINCEKAA